MASKTDSIPIHQTISSAADSAKWRTNSSGEFHLIIEGTTATTTQLEFSFDDSTYQVFSPGGQGDTSGSDQTFTGSVAKKYDVPGGLFFKVTNTGGSPSYDLFVNGRNVQVAS